MFGWNKYFLAFLKLSHVRNPSYVSALICLIIVSYFILFRSNYLYSRARRPFQLCLKPTKKGQKWRRRQELRRVRSTTSPRLAKITKINWNFIITERKIPRRIQVGGGQRSVETDQEGREAPGAGVQGRREALVSRAGAWYEWALRPPQLRSWPFVPYLDEEGWGSSMDQSVLPRCEREKAQPAEYGFD